MGSFAEVSAKAGNTSKVRCERGKLTYKPLGITGFRLRALCGLRYSNVAKRAAKMNTTGKGGGGASVEFVMG